MGGNARGFWSERGVLACSVQRVACRKSKSEIASSLRLLAMTKGAESKLVPFAISSFNLSPFSRLNLPPPLARVNLPPGQVVNSSAPGRVVRPAAGALRLYEDRVLSAEYNAGASCYLFGNSQGQLNKLDPAFALGTAIPGKPPANALPQSRGSLSWDPCPYVTSDHIRVPFWASFLQ